ncbi:MAG: FkbM family methyltransferase [Simkaniaceae bacterium]|nr:MAG: FkbM family methyltransferase [Simkaniaceae bacterium]
MQNYQDIKSQFLQDEYINEHFFKNKKNGVFLDIGAGLPIEDNNTYFLESKLGWTGLCIDPHPRMFEKLKATRKCLCLDVAVVPFHKGTMEFMQLDKLKGLSGLVDYYGEQDKERINTLREKVGDVPEIISVKTLPINHILETHSLFRIDFLSLDIEGGELDVLKAIDFDRFFIDVVSVENNWEDPWFQEAKNSTIRKYMESANYQYITRLGVDEIYRKKKNPY